MKYVSDAVRKELDAISESTETQKTKKHSNKFFKRLFVCYKLKKKNQNK